MLSILSLCTRFKKDCPIIIPMMISATTTGKIDVQPIYNNWCKNAARTTMTSEKNSILSPHVKYDMNVVAKPK